MESELKQLEALLGECLGAVKDGQAIPRPLKASLAKLVHPCPILAHLVGQWLSRIARPDARLDAWGAEALRRLKEDDDRLRMRPDDPPKGA
jgi:hypothetical protein